MKRKIGRSIAESILEQLRDEIRAGVLKPGESLRQNIIAEKFGVSSTPVREALVLLEREGLAQRETHRGAVVFQPTVEDLINCYEIREALEVLSIRKAALRISNDEIQELFRLTDKMRTTSEISEYLALNEQFHQTIDRASGSERLTSLIASQRAATITYFIFLGIETGPAEDSEAEHYQIIKALESGDPDAAEAAISHHLRIRADSLRLRLKQRIN